MRRKIVWIAGPVLLACLFFTLGWRYPAAACGAALVVLLIVGKIRRWPWPLGLALLSYTAALLYSWGYTALLVSPVRQLDEQTQVVWASVRETPTRYEDSQRALLRMKVETEDGERTIKTYAYLPLEEELSAGDRVRAEFFFYLPDVQDGFERQEYYLSQGVPILSSCQEILEVEHDSPLWAYPQRAASALRRAIAELYDGDAAALMEGLLLGEKSGMSWELSLILKRAGLSHVVAVSGMHVGIVVGALCLFLGKKHGSILALLFIFFFAGMAGATPSILRAVMMYTLLCLAWLLGREVDSFSSLCAALLVLLAANPYAVQSVSLQLSFAATAGILLWGNRITWWLQSRFPEKVRGRVLRSAAAAAGCSISASALTFPLLLIHFQWTTVTAPLTNILVLWLIPFVFTAGFLSCGLYFLFAPAAQLLATVVSFGETYVLLCARLSAAIPMQTLYADRIWTWIFLILAAGTAAAAAVLAGKARLRRFLVMAGGVVTVLALVAAVVTGEKQTRAVALPTGWGQNLLVKTEGRVLAIDCGASGYRNGAELTEEWMAQQQAEEIDLLILTAVDLTHARNVPELLERVRVHRLLMPEEGKNQELYDTIVDLAETQGTERIDRETAEEFLPGLTVDESIEYKLTVAYRRGDVNFLTLHSLTANMALEWMESAPGYPDAVCVLSPNLWEDTDKLETLVEWLAPRCLIFPSNQSLPDSFAGIPCYNSMDLGELSLTQ